MDSLRKFLCPEFIFGSGALNLAGRYTEHMGASRVLLVTDPGIRQAGWAEKAIESLKSRNIPYVLFDSILPNPRDFQVAEGAEVYRNSQCDVILAVGGGSVLDAAKGIGIVAANGGDILDYEGVDAIPNPIPPLVCVPTTCGSSADVSQFAIITDTGGARKIAIISKAVVPDTSLIDPDTLETMDRQLMAEVSLDTLTHAVEAFVSLASSFMTDRHALGAISLIGQNLIAALDERQNPELRSAIMQASLEAGLAFSNASLGLVHSMAHVLGGLKDFPHGLCNGLLLQNVCDYNYEACPERFDRLAGALSNRVLSGRQAVSDAIGSMVEATGICTDSKEYRISPEEISTLAKMSLNDACVVTNPREPSVEDIEAIYEKTFGS